LPDDATGAGVVVVVTGFDVVVVAGRTVVVVVAIRGLAVVVVVGRGLAVVVVAATRAFAVVVVGAAVVDVEVVDVEVGGTSRSLRGWNDERLARATSGRNAAMRSAPAAATVTGLPPVAVGLSCT